MEIKNPGVGIDFTTVDLLEASTTIRLPADYRKFLLEFNGGSPDPNTIYVAGVEYMPTVLQVFFGIGRKIQSSNLDWNFENAFDRPLDPMMFPIATDTFGNLFCFQTENGFARKIFYYSFEGESFEFHYVCDTFTELLEKLY